MPAPQEIPAGLEVLVVDHPWPLRGCRSCGTSARTVRPRAALRDLTVILVYEASRNLTAELIPIDTPVAATGAIRLANPPLLVPVLRAGLGMADQAHALMPESRKGFVGLARDEVTPLPTPYMESLPKLAGRPSMSWIRCWQREARCCIRSDYWPRGEPLMSPVTHPGL
jgi:uracil phosphoribosyltransferase